MTTKEHIEKAIRKAVIRHLVQHVQVPGDDRDRIDILVDEAALEIEENIGTWNIEEHGLPDIEKDFS